MKTTLSRAAALLIAVSAVPACGPAPVLSAVLSSASRVDLAWTRPPADQFLVERSLDGTSFERMATLPGTAESYADTTVRGGTTYHYRIGSLYGDVVYSNVARVTTPWAAAYGGPDDQDALAIRPLPDGGFVMAGDLGRPGAGDWDAWVLRLSPEGRVAWQEALGTGLGEWASNAVPTSDGGIVLVGECQWRRGSGDAWVARLDGQGRSLWQRRIGGDGYDELLGIEQTPDGGFIASGTTDSAGAGSGDLWVVRLAADGTPQWQRTYGGAGAEGPWDYSLPIRRTSDGGYVLCSGTTSFGAGSWDVWVLKLDADGNVLWERAFGGASDELPAAVIETSGGDLVVAATTTSFGAGNGDVWILRLSPGGELVWDRTFGGAGDEAAYGIAETRDGGLVTAAVTNSFGVGSYDAWILKLEGDGRIAWQRTYGGAGSEVPFAMQVHETPDGGLVVAGSTASTASGSYDAWAMKLARDGTIDFSPSSGFRTAATPVTGRSTARLATPTGAGAAAAALGAAAHHAPERKTAEPVTPLAP